MILKHWCRCSRSKADLQIRFMSSSTFLWGLPNAIRLLLPDSIILFTLSPTTVSLSESLTRAALSPHAAPHCPRFHNLSFSGSGSPFRVLHSKQLNSVTLHRFRCLEYIYFLNTGHLALLHLYSLPCAANQNITFCDIHP